MGLSTSRPVRRGKTGVIYFRKAVPKDLWTILGRREIKVSLKTCSGAEAPILLEWLSLIKWIDVDGDPSISERRPHDGRLNRRPTLVWSR